MVDITHRNMRFRPWTVNEKKTTEQNTAIRETARYFVNQGGNINELVKLLNGAIPEKQYHIEVKDLLQDSDRIFGEEFFFHFICLSKQLIGRDDFYFGEGSDIVLSEQHRIYERGTVRFQSWHESAQDYAAKGFSLMNIRLPLIYLKEKGEDPAELLSWFFSFLPKEQWRDESYFNNDFFHVSCETCLLFHSLFIAWCNDIQAVSTVFHKYYASPIHSIWTQFFCVSSKEAVKSILEMRRQTISVFNETIKAHNGKIHWEIHIQPEKVFTETQNFEKSGLFIGNYSNLGALRAILEKILGKKVKKFTHEILWKDPGTYGGKYTFTIGHPRLKRVCFLICISLLFFGLYACYIRLAERTWRWYIPFNFTMLTFIFYFTVSIFFHTKQLHQKLCDINSITRTQLKMLDEITKHNNQQEPKEKEYREIIKRIDCLPLSKREKEIGSLIVTGLCSKEIAARLHISKKYVENRTGDIYKKLGVTSRASFVSHVYHER